MSWLIEIVKIVAKPVMSFLFKKKIKVEVSLYIATGMATFTHGNGGLSITIKNYTAKAMALHEIGFYLKGDQQLIKIQNRPFPLTINPEDSYSYYFSYDELGDNIKYVKRAFCRDALERVYKSKKIKRSFKKARS